MLYTKFRFVIAGIYAPALALHRLYCCQTHNHGNGRGHNTIAHSDIHNVEDSLHSRHCIDRYAASSLGSISCRHQGLRAKCQRIQLFQQRFGSIHIPIRVNRFFLCIIRENIYVELLGNTFKCRIIYQHVDFFELFFIESIAQWSGHTGQPCFIKECRKLQYLLRSKAYPGGYCFFNKLCRKLFIVEKDFGGYFKYFIGCSIVQEPISAILLRTRDQSKNFS